MGEAEPRQIGSGIRAFHTFEEMQGHRVCVLCNLKPRKLGGFPQQRHAAVRVHGGPQHGRADRAARGRQGGRARDVRGLRGRGGDAGAGAEEEVLGGVLAGTRGKAD